MNIFPKDKVKPGEILTEKDYENAATKAVVFAILGWILSGGLIGILLEAYVFKYVDRAKKSSNEAVVKKALVAKRIAIVYWGLISAGLLFIPFLIFIDSNILLSIISGVAIIVIIILIIWFQKKSEWSKKKFVMVIIGLTVYAFLASFYVFTIKGDDDLTVENNQIIEETNFKNLSSAEIVNKINKLSPSTQIVAYKKHSALIEEVGQVWLQNLQGDNFELAINKTLPILLSQGWTEESARDALSWMTAKSFIILGRNPEGWCKGPDCKKQSDEEIKITLREDKTLSESIINGIFQELKIDNN